MTVRAGDLFDRFDVVLTCRGTEAPQLGPRLDRGPFREGELLKR